MQLLRIIHSGDVLFEEESSDEFLLGFFHYKISRIPGRGHDDGGIFKIQNSLTWELKSIKQGWTELKSGKLRNMKPDSVYRSGTYHLWVKFRYVKGLPEV